MITKRIVHCHCKVIKAYLALGNEITKLTFCNAKLFRHLCSSVNASSSDRVKVICHDFTLTSNSRKYMSDFAEVGVSHCRDARHASKRLVHLGYIISSAIFSNNFMKINARSGKLRSRFCCGIKTVCCVSNRIIRSRSDFIPAILKTFDSEFCICNVCSSCPTTGLNLTNCGLLDLLCTVNQTVYDLRFYLLADHPGKTCKRMLNVLNAS